MARKLRIQFPGAIYHLMNRGDRRENIFRDDFDRESFLQTLADTCTRTGWQVHAFCLMPNHFHLVVETPQPNLVMGIKWFLGTYTARFNRRHKLSGHVFAGRYKSLLVGGEGGYLRTVCDYVHLNPVRAKLLRTENPLRSYRWSSFIRFLGPAEQRPGWLRVDRLFGECGIEADSSVGRQEFERRLEDRRHQGSDEEFQAVRRGWCFGDEEFRQELLSQVEGEVGRFHYGAEVQEASEAKAARIIDEELRRAAWSEADLTLRKKGDPAKVRMARRLRTETTMTLHWIAARLHMGTKGHLSHLLYWQQRAESEKSTPHVAKRLVKSARPESRRAEPTNPPLTERPSIPNEGKNRPADGSRGRLVHMWRPSRLADTNNTIPLTDPSVFDPTFD
jgi:REP element-mobilizing transposase RayT